MKLGDSITVAHIYHRRTRYRYNGRYQQTIKCWESSPIKPRAAIYLGLRTLSNGAREWEDDVGAVYTPDADGYIKAALVCFSTRESPVYVPIDAIEATA